MRALHPVVDRALDDLESCSRDPRFTSPDSNARRDGGFSLTETTLAIALMGTVILVIISGLTGVIRVSSTSNDAARVEAMLTSAADRLAGWAYLSCPEANSEGYEAVVAAAADDVGWTHPNVLTITEYRYWDPTLNAPADGSDPVAADGGWATSNALEGTEACGEDVNFTTSRTLQRITIEARSPDGDIVRHLEVVKSNVGDRIETAP